MSNQKPNAAQLVAKALAAAKARAGEKGSHVYVVTLACNFPLRLVAIPKFSVSFTSETGVETRETLETALVFKRDSFDWNNAIPENFEQLTDRDLDFFREEALNDKLELVSFEKVQVD